MNTQIDQPKTDWDLRPAFRADEKDVYSADDLIDAYLRGKTDMLNSFENNAMYEAFGKNLEQAKNLSAPLYEKIVEEGIKCNRVYLKIKNRKRFNALFSVDEEQWLAGKLKPFYDEAREIEKKHLSKTFDFAIIFMPKSEHFNYESLLADGYLLSYGNED